MTSLRTVQVWSVLTKIGTVALGVVQTIVVLRLLGPEAYGLVGIVISIGALVGVSQHVGVVDAAIREIAVAETPERRAAVFWVSLWFRLIVTVPISILLFLLAPWIGARVYVLPDIAHLVRMMSVVLVLHGVQGVIGGAYSGYRAFGVLYVLQLVMAALNVPIFTGFVWWHGVRGYFEAVLAAASGFIILLAVSLRWALGGRLVHPRREEIRHILGDILHTGAWTYVARILSVAWQRVPVLLLGRWADPAFVGLFSAATTFGSKLQLLAAALGEVNLAYLSHAFAQGRIAFRRLAARTLDDVGAVTLLGALFLALFADVLVPLLAGSAYAGAAALVPSVTWAYAAFAFLDVAANTVFVPARRAHLRALSFGVLCAVTIGTMLVLRATPERAATWGLLAGGLAGLAVASAAAGRMRVILLPRSTLLPAALSVLAVVAPMPSLFGRAVVFSLLAAWIVWVSFPSLVRLVFGRPAASREDDAARSDTV